MINEVVKSYHFGEYPTVEDKIEMIVEMIGCKFIRDDDDPYARDWYLRLIEEATDGQD